MCQYSSNQIEASCKQKSSSISSNRDNEESVRESSVVSTTSGITSDDVETTVLSTERTLTQSSNTETSSIFSSTNGESFNGISSTTSSEVAPSDNDDDRFISLATVPSSDVVSNTVETFSTNNEFQQSAPVSSQPLSPSEFDTTSTAKSIVGSGFSDNESFEGSGDQKPHKSSIASDVFPTAPSNQLPSLDSNSAGNINSQAVEDKTKGQAIPEESIDSSTTPTEIGIDTESMDIQTNDEL